MNQQGIDEAWRMMGRADGKRVVVIGGGQRDGETIGIGRATATLFARFGAEILVVDLDKARAKATVEQIEEEGGRAHAFGADISQAGASQLIMDHAADVLGGVDVLINNVGVFVGDSHGNNLSAEVFDQVMTVNLKATWLCSQACIPLMRKAGGGVIINTSSVAALNMSANFAYGLSKSGVNALTSRMAIENARFNIRIHAVMPGTVATPMMFESQLPESAYQTREQFLEARAELISRRAQLAPLKRVGSAWDIANAMVFLASDEASFMTGILLPVDGGYHLIRAGGCGNPE